MRIRWTVPAAADLEFIKHYLDLHLPHLSTKSVRRLYDGIRSLRTMPERGRLGLKQGTREIIFPPLPYLVTYRIFNQTVEVLHPPHSARSFGTVGKSARPYQERADLTN